MVSLTAQAHPHVPKTINRSTALNHNGTNTVKLRTYRHIFVFVSIYRKGADTYYRKVLTPFSVKYVAYLSVTPRMYAQYHRRTSP